MMLNIRTVTKTLCAALAGCSFAAGNVEPSRDWRDLEQMFLMPPNEYRLTQYAGKSTPDSIDLFREYGAGGVKVFFPPSGVDSETVRTVEYAIQKNMRIWVNDDSGYPSGLGGGKVVEGNPEYEICGLLHIDFYGEGPHEKIFSLPDDAKKPLFSIVYPIENGMTNYMAGMKLPIEQRRTAVKNFNGEWVLCMFALNPIDHDSQAQRTMKQFGHNGHYGDVMSRAAMKKYIQVRHEAFMDAVGDAGQDVVGFYSNEANLMTYYWNRGSVRKYAYASWTDELPATFFEMHGYPVESKLLMIYQGDTIEAKRFRIHYYQTVAELFAKNFAGQITEFCHERGVLSGGHYMWNEFMSSHVGGYGDQMKFAASFDVPGIDIGVPVKSKRDSYPYEQVKWASSIAGWKETDLVTCLIDPVIDGAGVGRMSPEISSMYDVVNRMYLYGVNEFFTYASLLPRNDPGSAVAGTGYSKEEYRTFNDYTARIGVFLRGAENDTSIALYYPIAAFQSEFKATGKWFYPIFDDHRKRAGELDDVVKPLVKNGIDFNYVHPEAVSDAVIVDGKLEIGKHRYTCVIMPQMDIIPLPVVEKLQAFEKTGGRVLWADRKPAYTERAENQKFLNTSGMHTLPGAEVFRRIKNGSSYDSDFSVQVESEPDHVLVTRFRRDGKKLYYLVNKSEKPVTVFLKGKPVESVTLYDPSSGDISQPAVPDQFPLREHRSVLFVHE